MAPIPGVPTEIAAGVEFLDDLLRGGQVEKAVVEKAVLKAACFYVDEAARSDLSVEAWKSLLSSQIPFPMVADPTARDLMDKAATALTALQTNPRFDYLYVQKCVLA